MGGIAAIRHADIPLPSLAGRCTIICAATQLSQSERDALVVDNQALVHCIAHRLTKSSQNVRVLGIEDAVSAGMIGLVKAARLYDPQRAKFSTLAYKVVKREILRQAYAWDTIRLPHSFSLEQRVARHVPCCKFADRSTPVDKASEPTRDDGLDVDIIPIMLSALEPLQRRITIMAYGLGGRSPMTIRDISACEMMGHKRVREVMSAAMAAMKEYLGVAPPLGPPPSA